MPNELDIARGIRDGDLPSPQKFGDNLWLFAMRITGTGTAYRSKLDELVFRDPDIFLTEDFLERCQGLPVIVQHPKNDKLEFQGICRTCGRRDHAPIFAGLRSLGRGENL